jgi:hypothetical protein
MRKYKSDGKDKWDAYMVPRDQFLHDEYYVGQQTEFFHCEYLSYARRSEILKKDVYEFASVNAKEYKAKGNGILVDYRNSRFGKT